MSELEFPKKETPQLNVYEPNLQPFGFTKKKAIIQCPSPPKCSFTLTSKNTSKFKIFCFQLSRILEAKVPVAKLASVLQMNSHPVRDPLRESLKEVVECRAVQISAEDRA